MVLFNEARPAMKVYALYRLSRDKEIKKRLLDTLKARSNTRVQKSICEWLWEDFGINVRCDWMEIERKILKEKGISARDLATFMIREGIKVDENLWLSG